MTKKCIENYLMDSLLQIKLLNILFILVRLVVLQLISLYLYENPHKLFKSLEQKTLYFLITKIYVRIIYFLVLIIGQSSAISKN